MTAPRTPRNVAQATALLEHYAELADAGAHINNQRNAAIARVNADADAELTPLVAELDAIRPKIEAWWRAGGAAIAGKRKSAELGGCMIGSRKSRPKLAHGFEDDDKAVEALRATRYGRQTVRVKYSIDRAATLKLLQGAGKATETIAELGFSIDQGEDFFVERAEQAGTIKAG